MPKTTPTTEENWEEIEIEGFLGFITPALEAWGFRWYLEDGKFSVSRGLGVREAGLDYRFLLNKTAAEARAEALSEPMGVSQWMAHGKKYGYDKYYRDQVIEEAIEIINGLNLQEPLFPRIDGDSETTHPDLVKEGFRMAVTQFEKRKIKAVQRLEKLKEGER